MMNFTSLPFLDILQSVYVCPPSSQISIALNLKVILGKEADPHPFFGIWVLDLSSSMLDDRKIDAAIASLKEQINFLPEGTIFSLITFGNPVEALVNKMEINSSNRKALFWTIDNLVPRGSTPFREALDKTFEI
ncbi:MAG: VWA domain-containing protein, partial [Promethearchaeota archaeon]